MVPNQPGLEDSEVQGAGTPDAETSQPIDSTASNSAEAAAPEEQPATRGEEVAESPEAPNQKAPSPPTPSHGLKRGDLKEGVIKETSPLRVVVDIDGVPAVIPTQEIERMPRAMVESLKVGEPITVYVLNARENKEVVVSVNRALEELDWKLAEEYRSNQQVYESRVAGYNKGGLIVRFGRLRGFVPQSQLSTERRISGEEVTPEQRWGSMVNQPIAVKVMEVDHPKNRLILSERQASRESREKRKETLISQITTGETRTGRVVSLEDFGAFIDIGGAEGLVHLTELSWQHVTHPRDVLKVGQEVQVEVISVDQEAKRIGLSLKSQQEDPWDTVTVKYAIGQLVQATITKLTKFGAFAQLTELPEIEGLIHISELSDKRVTHPRDVVTEGDIFTLRIVKIDHENRRLGLSLKRVHSAEYLDLDWGGSEE